MKGEDPSTASGGVYAILDPNPLRRLRRHLPINGEVKHAPMIREDPPAASGEVSAIINTFP